LTRLSDITPIQTVSKILAIFRGKVKYTGTFPSNSEFEEI
jgi:hypothetical protein